MKYFWHYILNLSHCKPVIFFLNSSQEYSMMEGCKRKNVISGLQRVEYNYTQSQKAHQD